MLQTQLMEDVKLGKYGRVPEHVQNKDLNYEILGKIGRKIERTVKGLRFEGAEDFGDKTMTFTDNDTKRAFKEFDKIDRDDLIKRIREKDPDCDWSDDELVGDIVNNEVDNIVSILCDKMTTVSSWLWDNYPKLAFRTEFFAMEPGFNIVFERVV